MKFRRDEDRGSARPAGAAPGTGAVGQPAHRHHQTRFVLFCWSAHCGAAGTVFIRAELPNILATHPMSCRQRMVRVIEGLAGDWRRLSMSGLRAYQAEIETVATPGRRLRTADDVPGIDRSSPAQWWPQSAVEMPSPKVVTSPPGWGSSQDRCRPATRHDSWAGYPSAAIVNLRVRCSCRRHGRVDQAKNLGALWAQEPWIERPRRGCITTLLAIALCQQGSPELPGAFWLEAVIFEVRKVRSGSEPICLILNLCRRQQRALKMRSPR